MLSSCLCSVKVSSKVPISHYEEETNAYMGLSLTAERNYLFALEPGILVWTFYHKTVPHNGAR